MTDGVVIPLVVAAGTAVLMWVMGWVRTFLAKRITVESPESKAISELRAQLGRDMKTISASIRKSDAVQDAIMDAQIVQSKVLRAICEAQQGKVNGNIERAIKMIDASDSQFDAFLRSRVRSDFEELESAE